MGALWVHLFLLVIYALFAKFFGYLRGFGVFIGLFALVIAYVNIGLRHECVVMHNGLLIGRATVFSQMHEDEHGLPDIAIKHPDGRLLHRGDGSIHFYNHESVGGDFPGTVRGRNNQFIYIRDAGLTIESEEPERFRYYWDQRKKDVLDNKNKQQERDRLKLPPWRWNEDRGEWYYPEHHSSGLWQWVDGAGSNLYLLYNTLYSNPRNRRKWCPTAWFSP